MGTYIRNMAVSAIGELGITLDNLPQRTASSLYVSRGHDIGGFLNKMLPITWATIALEGRGVDSKPKKATRMIEVHQTPGEVGTHWLPQTEDGSYIIRQLALAALIAEITDVILKRC